MSTIYAFKQECPALGAVPASDDVFLLHDTSAGTSKTVTGALMAEAARTVTAGSTATNFPAYGIIVSSTLAKVYTLDDPTQAGQEVSIVFPSSTAIQTVAPAAATINGSTVTVGSATKITHTGTSDALGGMVTLFASSTSKWNIKAMTAGAGITST